MTSFMNFSLRTVHKLSHALPFSKLRQLAIRNRIVDDSDSKLSKFGRQFTDDYDFIVQIVSSISISFWSFSIEFDQFSIKRLKKITLILIERLKKVIFCNQGKHWKMMQKHENPKMCVLCNRPYSGNFHSCNMNYFQEEEAN